MLQLDNIKIAVRWSATTYFPIDDRIFNIVINNLINEDIKPEIIIRDLQFTYVTSVGSGWDEICRTADNKTIRTYLSMKVNPAVRLRDQEGLYQLEFLGKMGDTIKNVDTLAKCLELYGRRVYPVLFNATRDSKIPKRIDNLPRF